MHISIAHFQQQVLSLGHATFGISDAKQCRRF